MAASDWNRAEVCTLLTEAFKTRAREGYSSLLNLKGYQPRRPQGEMVAEVSRVFGNGGILLLEAETGIGKTVGYGLPGLFMAQERGCKLVISTATVTLQQQLLDKDLQDLLEATGLPMQLAVAKGRRRYFCPSLYAASRRYQQAELVGMGISGGENSAVYSAIDRELEEGWDGDMDLLSVPLRNSERMAFTASAEQCSGPNCAHFKDCPFFAARRRVEDADVIVANHSLVLAHLFGGGHSPLPAPADCIMVFDEAHNLAATACRHLSADRALEDIARDRQDLLGQVESLRGLVGSGELDAALQRTAAAVQAGGDTLQLLNLWAETLSDEAHFAQPDAEQRQLLEACKASAVAVAEGLSQALAAVDAQVSDGHFTQQEASDWQLRLGGFFPQLEHEQYLWHSYTNDDPGWARWFRRDGERRHFAAEPLSAAEPLRTQLWSQVLAAVLTSATLTSMGSFALMREELGIPDEGVERRMTGVLDHARQGRLIIPAMQSEPSDAMAHTDELIEQIPDWLAAAGRRADRLYLTPADGGGDGGVADAAEPRIHAGTGHRRNPGRAAGTAP